MFTKAALVVVLVGVVLAAPDNLYGAPHQQYREEPKPYNFNYGVKDDYAGTDFSQNEESDGNTVQGSYTVQLPDGRKQTVTYVADDYGGYRAEVEYYGEAQYPHEYGPPITFKPQAYGQPSYQPPQPSYQPSYQPPVPSYQ
ncbi:cuticle protein-like [Homarus americanus]|uniref:cuticle protein-like n=1 Tax=Homarus americanus TaxID=6706 RepID=UPI001C43DAF7|nr:cuticle protein-like [Homarus americanus]